MTGPAAYTGVAAVVALLIGLVGASIPAATRDAVWVGVALGYAAQMAAFWAFFVWIVPGRRILAHGLGMVWRMVVVGITALLLLGAETAIVASMLFALVAFFFVSTVLEPLFLRTEPLTRR
jgi:hypothetical protein